jgi:hypothetical protein
MADKTGADRAEHEDGQDGTPNIEERLSKLEKLLADTSKALEDERRDKQGKDKKITELVNERNKLQEATMSKDKLLELRESELNEQRADWEKQRVAEKEEIERLRLEVERNKVVAKLGVPPFLADRIRGKNADEMEADAREIMKKWVNERDKVDNVRKVTPTPKTGGSKPQKSYGIEDFQGAGGKELFASLPAEERERLFNESLERE